MPLAVMDPIFFGLGLVTDNIQFKSLDRAPVILGSYNARHQNCCLVARRKYYQMAIGVSARTHAA